MLLSGQFNVGYPTADRGGRDSQKAGDLLDGSPFFPSHSPCSFALFRFHFRKHSAESGRRGKSGRRESNPRRRVGNPVLHHSATPAFALAYRRCSRIAGASTPRPSSSSHCSRWLTRPSFGGTPHPAGGSLASSPDSG